jgi:predicted MPP superfamily phosphohydrolase
LKRDYRLRLTKTEHDLIKNMRDTNANNILVIGDLHEPFCLDEYLDFCIEKYFEFQCDEVVFIGDCIDNHYASYHETYGGVELMTGAEELDLAIKRIARWRDAFPVATILVGNHDRLIMRKSQTSAIPNKWIKSYKEVLEVPDWNFVERYEKNGVQYIHGEGGTARTKCRADMMNTVQGHLHTQAYCEHYVGQNFRVFGMQVGCGIDHESYAMAYAKYGKKPAIGCGVVLNNGKLPVNLLMEL